MALKTLNANCDRIIKGCITCYQGVIRYIIRFLSSPQGMWRRLYFCPTKQQTYIIVNVEFGVGEGKIQVDDIAGKGGSNQRCVETL